MQSFYQNNVVEKIGTQYRLNKKIDHDIDMKEINYEVGYKMLYCAFLCTCIHCKSAMLYINDSHAGLEKSYML